jgi:protein O-mannosyl-transferase
MQWLAATIKHSWLQILLIILAVIAVYGHSLDVPFYLDDFSSIQENPIIYQWQGGLYEIWQFAPMRTVAYLTFALNYQLHQFQVQGYHVVNIAIHILASLSVWALLFALMRAPSLQHLSPNTKLWLPLIAALIFALHPLQVQSVTYIVQRLASLAALFYLLAMLAFVQARLSQKLIQKIIWLSLLIIFFGLGMLTKQNVVTLPLAILLLELSFFTPHRRNIIIASIVILGGLIITWFLFAVILKYNPFSLQAMLELTKETTAISREQYLATQLGVLWVYIKLFFLPLGLHIDYDYPLTTSLWQLQPLMALIGHLGLIIIAILTLKRWPLVGFGILFYYLSHAVESSIIPIRDVIFEHRTYLPNLGLAILCAWLLVDKLLYIDKKLAIMLIIAIILTLGSMTWLRNQMWRDPISLWQHNVTLSPNKQRAWIILGKHLIQADRPHAGIEALLRSGSKVRQADGSVSTTYSLETLLNLVVAYRKLQQYNQALNIIEQVISEPDIDNFNLSKFYINRGNIYYELAQYSVAENSYQTAIKLYPQGISAYANLASIFAATGRLHEAEQLYLEVLTFDPHNTVILQNLAKIRQLLAN